MTSAFVCASLGIVPTERHADYIGSWLEVLREDDRAIVRVASTASKAADYLLAFRPESDEFTVSGKSGDVPASQLSLGVAS
jgi:antirestriction protein ArdC